jgi:hypothetical protein
MSSHAKTVAEDALIRTRFRLSRKEDIPPIARKIMKDLFSTSVHGGALGRDPQALQLAGNQFRKWKANGAAVTRALAREREAFVMAWKKPAAAATSEPGVGCVSSSVASCMDDQSPLLVPPTPTSSTPASPVSISGVFAAKQHGLDSGLQASQTRPLSAAPFLLPYDAWDDADDNDDDREILLFEHDVQSDRMWVSPRLFGDSMASLARALGLSPSLVCSPPPFMLPPAAGRCSGSPASMAVASPVVPVCEDPAPVLLTGGGGCSPSFEARIARHIQQAKAMHRYTVDIMVVPKPEVTVGGLSSAADTQCQQPLQPAADVGSDRNVVPDHDDMGGPCFDPVDVFAHGGGPDLDLGFVQVQNSE